MPASYRKRDIIKMFGDMAATYGRVNLVTSFGFSHLWRKACVRAVDLKPGDGVADLMAGMGEASTLAAQWIGSGEAEITAVDFCPEMCARAKVSPASEFPGTFEVHCADVFEHAFGRRFERIVCSFGLKTLTPDQQQDFVDLLRRLLEPGGTAALVEISVPRNPLLRLPYAFYLKWVIPMLGRLLMGNPDCYRNLYRYTVAFARENRFLRTLCEAGFEATERPLFFGCAKLYVARHPV